MEEQILRFYLKISSIFFIVSFIFFLYLYNIVNKKIYLKNEIINISKNEDIVNILNSNFLEIKYFEKKIFKYYYRINSYFNLKSIHHGDFYIEEHISFVEFLNLISKPSNVLNKITIIEGWSKIDLNNELSKHFEKFQSIEYDEIIADTFYYNKDESFEDFYYRLKKHKEKFISNLNKKSKSNMYNEKELFIIASMIEKEGLDYQDKMIISSVIDNRLNKNMKLQIDATVIYAITNGRYNLNRKLFYEDYKFNHPYNTYIINGLPPTPIAYVSPNTINIIQKNYKSDFLFYFYNNTLKKHIFSKNYNDHKIKLNEYRKQK